MLLKINPEKVEVRKISEETRNGVIQWAEENELLLLFVGLQDKMITANKKICYAI
jgi:hypothetical protein